MKYRYLLQKVQYVGGYIMELYPLPGWIYLTIDHNIDERYKQLVVHSRIHMNKEVKMNPIYDESFSSEDIIKDLSGEISSRFL